MRKRVKEYCMTCNTNIKLRLPRDKESRAYCPTCGSCGSCGSCRNYEEE